MAALAFNKRERVAAYRVVDEILGRSIPAVVLRHQTEGMDAEQSDAVVERAGHILNALREDARDLWGEQ